MQFLVSLFNTFSGPIGGLVEKGILAAVMWALGKGYIAGDAAGIAATLYAAVSAVFTAVTKSTTGKIVSINTDQQNGVKVVPAGVTAAAVNAPL